MPLRESTGRHGLVIEVPAGTDRQALAEVIVEVLDCGLEEARAYVAAQSQALSGDDDVLLGLESYRTKKAARAARTRALSWGIRAYVTTYLHHAVYLESFGSNPPAVAQFLAHETRLDGPAIADAETHCAEGRLSEAVATFPSRGRAEAFLADLMARGARGCVLQVVQVPT